MKECVKCGRLSVCPLCKQCVFEGHLPTCQSAEARRIIESMRRRELRELLTKGARG